MVDLQVSADAKWELTILEIVHGFYCELLRKTLGEDVLVPIGLDTDSLRAPSDPGKTLIDCRRWLKLLDLAIAPAMIREALTGNVDQDLAEAMLRYFVRKKSHTTFDRDKTDFIVTYLYRNPRVKGQWESRGYSMDGVAPIPPFEIALLEVLEGADLPDLTPDHARMLDEFDYLRDEADGFRTFDELMDSDIIQRVRQMKDSFGAALYHPHVLSVVASYNAFFATKFEELFKTAAAHIKNFAEEAQQNGASIHAQVQGNITVKQLTEVREDDILAGEYVSAQEQLHYVSKLKKAVDSRSAAQHGSPSAYPARVVPPTPAPPPFSSSTRAPEPLLDTTPFSTARMSTPNSPASAVRARAVSQPTSGVQAGSGNMPISNKRVEEENRLASVQESVRSFVRTADPRYRSIVPMGFGNLVLMPAEADAYCADYLQEKSFRGDNVRALMRIPALVARMTSEIEQIERQQNLKYLWRPHAESLAMLLVIGEEVAKSGGELIQLATQRGLADKVNVLNNSLQKLKSKSGQATALLTMMNARD